MPEPWRTFPIDPGSVTCLQQLPDVISVEVRQNDNPYFPLLHGCYDWHSAVHGHWALLAGTRFLLKDVYSDPNTYVSGDIETLRERAETSFSLAADRLLSAQGVKNLEMELRGLLGDTSFEMPYGRAWMLLLLKTLFEVVDEGRGGGPACNSGGAQDARHWWHKDADLLCGFERDPLEELGDQVADQLFRFLLDQFGVKVETSDAPTDILEKVYLFAERSYRNDESRFCGNEAFALCCTPEYRNPCFALLILWLWDHRFHLRDHFASGSNANPQEMSVQRKARLDFVSSIVTARLWSVNNQSGAFSDALLADGDLTKAGFFSTWGLLFLLVGRYASHAAVDDYWDDVLDKQGIKLSIPRASTPINIDLGRIVSGAEPQRVHQLGLNATRMWGLTCAGGGRASASTPNDTWYRGAWCDHMATYASLIEDAEWVPQTEGPDVEEEDTTLCDGEVRRHLQWGSELRKEWMATNRFFDGCGGCKDEIAARYRRYAYSHWVPQFVLFAILLEEGAM